jgi:subtilase family serine protease
MRVRKDADKTYIEWARIRPVDERFRKEDVTPVWYKRSSYLIILGIIALIVIIVIYDLIFPATPTAPPPIVAP